MLIIPIPIEHPESNLPFHVLAISILLVVFFALNTWAVIDRDKKDFPNLKK